MAGSHILWINELARFTGGCEQYVYNTVRLLRQQGMRNTLLYDKASGPVDTQMLGAFDGAFPIYDPARQIDEIAPDVVYVHRLSNLPATRAIAGAGRPVLRFMHDYKLLCLREHRYDPIWLQTCTKPIGWRCYVCPGFICRGAGPIPIRFSSLRAMQRELAANKAFDIAVGSSYMADLMVAHGFEKSRIHTTPLYSLPPKVSADVKMDSLLLLYVGQLLRGKGIDTILKSLTLTYHPVHLDIVGEGHQGNLFRRMAATLGLEGRVRFLGRVPHDEISAAYGRALAVVVASRYPETFCLVGVEAMSHGRAVIGTTVGGIATWLCDGVTGIAFPPNDASGLAAAIDQLAANPHVAAEMGRRGQQAYEQQFRPECHINALLQVFDLLKNKHPRVEGSLQ